MAEASPLLPQEKSLEELEREIICGICQEYYTEPKILPCLHYYCKKCVVRLALKTGTGKPFYCPECRSEAILPKGGVDKLKTAFFVNRLKSKVTLIKQTYGTVEVKCELCECSSDSAKAFCRQCTRFICQQCVDLHKRIITFKSHEVATLEDLKLGQAKPIAVQESPTTKCPIHEEPLIIYCYDCDRLVCRDCTLKDHREHNFEFTKKVATDKKTKFLEEVKPLKNLHAKLTNAVESIQMKKIEIEIQRDTTIHSIKGSFKELHSILEKREKELVEEAGATAQEKINKLTEQEKTISMASAEVQSVVDYTMQCVTHLTDSEVMTMDSAEMKKTIQQNIEKHNQSEKNLKFVEQADMGVEVKCADTLQQLCQKQATIIKLIDPTKCTVMLEQFAVVGMTSKVMLTTRLSNGVQVQRNCKVTCQLKSLHHGVISDCNVKGESSGKYSITYKPADRGRHELTLQIDGQHMTGSPFTVCATLPPKQLSKPVQVWKGISRPTGITMMSTGDILVCEQAGGIIKLCNKGKYEKLVLQTELKSLINIAVDDEDNIYCIDDTNDSILTCDKNGENVQIRQVKLEKGNGRRGLSIVKNYLYISECGYENTILIYDKELLYVRQIQHKDMGQVSAICTDIQENIYACNSNSTVDIFNVDGSFVRSLCDKKTKLKQPCGMCVLGKHLYVATFYNSSISVFTTTGTRVISFGQQGESEGQFRRPMNLCTDKQGYIYICDCYNNRIQCF